MVSKAYHYRVSENSLKLYKDVGAEGYKAGTKLIRMYPANRYETIPSWSFVEIVRDTKTQVLVKELNTEGKQVGEELRFRKDDAVKIGQTGSYFTSQKLYHIDEDWLAEVRQLEELEGRRKRLSTVLERLSHHCNHRRDMLKGRHVTDVEVEKIVDWLKANIDEEEIFNGE